jgi:hypothetical protein
MNERITIAEELGLEIDNTLMDIKMLTDLAKEKAGVVFFEKYGHDDDASMLNWLVVQISERVDAMYSGELESNGLVMGDRSIDDVIEDLKRRPKKAKTV